MFSYPEEDRMEKMTPSAIRGRESERHTEEKKDGERGESFSADIAACLGMAVLLLLRACGSTKEYKNGST